MNLVTANDFYRDVGNESDIEVFHKLHPRMYTNFKSSIRFQDILARNNFDRYLPKGDSKLLNDYSAIALKKSSSLLTPINKM